ncbi:MAG: hypothetical protein DMG70_07165 [Acidobacteria bacterium]|nr:MAG: hypothetical protein DMG70_07165 [Acidobacteriota bacterium]PYY10762.1 MAG: hypothetical protein DMG69_05775 [Acidobacteriota bacterium]
MLTRSLGFREDCKIEELHEGQGKPTNCSRFWNMDFSLQKETKITERTVIQLSADAFNLLNHTNFARPIGRFDSSLFGRVTAITGNPRLLQLGARFIF